MMSRPHIHRALTETFINSVYSAQMPCVSEPNLHNNYIWKCIISVLVLQTFSSSSSDSRSQLQK